VKGRLSLRHINGDLAGIESFIKTAVIKTYRKNGDNNKQRNVYISHI
jgi:hypothetical protein